MENKFVEMAVSIYLNCGMISYACFIEYVKVINKNQWVKDYLMWHTQVVTKIGFLLRLN